VKWLCSSLLVLLVGAAPAFSAPDFGFRPPTSPGDAATPAIMSDLATRIIPVYQDSDAERYLANLSVLQMAAGEYSAADISRQSLRERRRKSDFGHPVGHALIYDIYAHARAMEGAGITFAEAFTNAYREEIGRLNDVDAYAVTRWIGAPPMSFRESLQIAFDQRRGIDSIDQAEAIELIWKFVAFDAYRNFGPLVVLLNAEDDHRRYTEDGDLVVRMRDGTSIAVDIIRPTGLAGPSATLFEFTARGSQTFVKECAAHGYACAAAYPRDDATFEHNGEDARAVINWITHQPWSDGRVAMYGEGMGAFAAWAVAKKVPAALKAIAVSAASAPGINVPMLGNIFQNSAYGWSLPPKDSADAAHWRALDQKWYRSGRRYRDLGRLNGKHNPLFIRWLNHPSFDQFWQQLTPSRREYSRINIPVLTMTGYYAASEPADLYIYSRHHHDNPRADHTLVVGPYDDGMLQFGTATNLHGYPVDSAAVVDFRELRYRWFDHVLKGSTVPPLLQDHVNYQVMGANEWRHAASLDSMAGSSVKFYLEGSGSGTSHRLSQRKRSNDSFVQQSVDFVNRADAAWTPSTDLISKILAPRHGEIYATEPLLKPIVFSGLFEGHLDFTVNKMDMDLNVTLYELLPNGDYVRLYSPTFEFRASYAQDRARRHLLRAGERQQLAFKSEKLTSRQLQSGSRLVMVLSVAKRPDREINYGTGGDVSEESLEDGKVPLKIRWYGDSYLEIPIHR
jgi:putative CocE/NonD family hydrolase